MSATLDILAPATEKMATVRSISQMVGTALTDIKGHICLDFSIQNKDGAKVLYVQDDDDATVANDNEQIDAGVTYRPPGSGWVKFDLREWFVRVSADDPVFSITVVWG